MNEIYNWIDLLVKDLSKKYTLTIERREDDPPYTTDKYLCFSNRKVDFYWFIKYDPNVLNRDLEEYYDGTFEQICYNLELAWNEHCRKLLYGEEVLTN